MQVERVPGRNRVHHQTTPLRVRCLVPAQELGLCLRHRCHRQRDPLHSAAVWEQALGSTSADPRKGHLAWAGGCVLKPPQLQGRQLLLLCVRRGCSPLSGRAPEVGRSAALRRGQQHLGVRQCLWLVQHSMQAAQHRLRRLQTIRLLQMNCLVQPYGLRGPVA